MRRMPTYQAVFRGMAAQNSLASQGWEACGQRGFHKFSIDVEELSHSLTLSFFCPSQELVSSRVSHAILRSQFSL